MCGCETLLAVALLTAPGDDFTAADLMPWLGVLRPALTDVAIHFEVLDPRETRYMLARDEDVATDLNLLRRRARDLLGGPPANDVCRFPGLGVIPDLLTANRAYRRYLEARQLVELSHALSLREALCETDQLYRIWDTLREARGEHQPVPQRRLALVRLRRLVGETAYYAGSLPPSVPVWRFTRIDEPHPKAAAPR